MHRVKIHHTAAQVDVGVIDQIEFGNPKSPRFVFWDKKLRPTPSGPDVLTFDLLSIGGKLRAGLGMFGLRPKMPGTHTACSMQIDSDHALHPTCLSMNTALTAASSGF